MDKATHKALRDALANNSDKRNMEIWKYVGNKIDRECGIGTPLAAVSAMNLEDLYRDAVRKYFPRNRYAACAYAALYFKATSQPKYRRWA